MQNGLQYQLLEFHTVVSGLICPGEGIDGVSGSAAGVVSFLYVPVSRVYFAC